MHYHNVYMCTTLQYTFTIIIAHCMILCIVRLASGQFYILLAIFFCKVSTYNVYTSTQTIITCTSLTLSHIHTHTAPNSIWAQLPWTMGCPHVETQGHLWSLQRGQPWWPSHLVLAHDGHPVPHHPPEWGHCSVEPWQPSQAHQHNEVPRWELLCVYKSYCLLCLCELVWFPSFVENSVPPRKFPWVFFFFLFQLAY